MSTSSRASAPRRSAALVAASALLCAPITFMSAVPASAAAGASAAAVTAVGGFWEFEYINGPEGLTIPVGVNSITIIATGAGGQPGGAVLPPNPAPGLGGTAMATFAVDPGDNLTVWVGGDEWGFGCGGEGGSGEGADGGGGGGASGVTYGTIPPNSFACDNDNRPADSAALIVGGGGGGGGGNFEGAGNGIGIGGDGGDPPGPGTLDGASKNCGGCESGPNGEDGSNSEIDGGGGGGGGGFLGGSGSNNDGANGSGGGGGSSYIAPTATSQSFFNGVQAGDGSVTIIAGAAQTFEECTRDVEPLTVPANVGIMRVFAVGGHGGTRTDGKSAAGGFGGFVSAEFDVNPGDQVDVGVGCYGGSDGGWGGWTFSGGSQGSAASALAYDGAGGGGASAVMYEGEFVAIAGGGGGGGGTGAGPGGGLGGDGGLQAQDGGSGEHPSSSAADGGCGGCVPGNAGQGGFGSSSAAQGGGGGGGGGGYAGGGGGLGGHVVAGGGGGGGGGSSFLNNSRPGTAAAGTSDFPSDGAVLIVWIPGGAAMITTYGGDDQIGAMGETFAQPLSARVTDLTGKPVSNTAVTFDLAGQRGVGGSFSDGSAIASVPTNEDGVAVSPPFSAAGATGAWVALATADLVHGNKAAEFTMTNMVALSTTGATITPGTQDVGEPFTFDAQVTLESGEPATSGTVTFTIDDRPGTQADVADGQAAGSYTPDPATPETWLPVGAHTLHVAYSGSTEVMGSSTAIPFHVTAIPVTITVVSSLNPADPGQPVSFTAKASVPSGATPVVGTIHFWTAVQDLGSAPIAADGTASVGPFTDLLPGPGVAVGAAFAGDATHASAEGWVDQTIEPDTTAITVSTTPNPSTYGAPVTYSATVIPSASIPLTPVGSVTFTAGGLDLCTGDLDTSAHTSCTSDTALDPGTHTVEASYASTSSPFADSSATTNHTVSPLVTTTTVSVAPETSVIGEAITFAASVDWGGHPPTATAGEIQFFVDGAAIGSAIPVGATAVTSPPVSDLTLGGHTVSAHYSGTSEYAQSTGHTTHKVDVASTTTALVASIDPSDPGEAVAFTATVSRTAPGGGVPVGTVRFRADGISLGPPIPLDGSGVAVSPEIFTLAPGTHEITATFTPTTGADAPSTGRVDHAVRTVSTTAVYSSSNPMTVGDPVTVSASVWPFDATGTVTFTVDGVSACTDVPFEPGTRAPCELVGLAVGDREVTATYSGSVQFTSSTGSLTEQVEQVVTTTRIVSSANPSVSGQLVSFTATVTRPDLSTPVTTGAVQFRVNGDVVGSAMPVDASGTAALSDVSTLDAGSNAVRADYLGTIDIAPSTDAVDQVVDRAATATLMTSSMNPSETGDAVTFTAHLQIRAPGAGTPTGTVQFSVDGIALGAPTVVAADGTATSVSIADLTVAAHEVIAVYSGDSAFAGSTGRLTQSVGPGATATHVTSSVSPSVFGEAVTFSARVDVADAAIGTPTGTVQFAVDGVDAGGPVELHADGTAQSDAFAALAVGHYIVTARYSGDTDFTASTGQTGHVVDRALTSTEVLASAPSMFGQPATFDAAITTLVPGAGTPVGTVQFVVDGEALGDPIAVTGGQATSPVIDTLLPGAHEVSALFTPGSNFRASSGERVAEVRAAATETIVESSLNPAPYGSEVTMSATVSADPVGAFKPSGEVDFRIDGVLVAQRVVLIDGIATLPPIDDLAVGDHTITASYGGTDGFEPSDGDFVQQILPSTKTTLSSSLNPSTSGQPVTFTATVAGAATAPSGDVQLAVGGEPFGNVQFSIDGELFGHPVALVDGAATSPTIANLTVGAHTIAAQFTGDGYAASRGELEQHVAGVAPPPTPPHGHGGLAGTGSDIATLIGLAVTWVILGGLLMLGGASVLGRHGRTSRM